jgi:hypothetical protein
VLRRDIAPDDQLPVSEARVRFRKLLTALRLFKSGAVAFGPVGWARVDEGAWQPVPIGLSGPSRGGPYTVTAEEQSELVELVELVLEARPGGRIAWALSRFEMGCERPLDTEALSDYLLALESLLDAADDAGRASLTLRLAALCAEDGERKSVQRRVELAFALERWVMGGGGANAYLEALGPDTPRSIVLELEQHVRALLRDVLCGYLAADLKSAADDILLASSTGEIEIKARDLRAEMAEGSPQMAEPDPEADEDELAPEPEPLPSADRGLPTPEADAAQDELPAGVTPSADWDEYSAPI